MKGTGCRQVKAMAKGKKTGGKDFKAGNCANPKGRDPVPSDVKAAKKLNTNQLILIFNKLIHMTEFELRAHLKNVETPKFERVVCEILNEAELKGDHYRLDFILNRLIGKVTEKVEHILPSPTIIYKSDGSQVILGAEIKKQEGDEE